MHTASIRLPRAPRHVPSGLELALLAVLLSSVPGAVSADWLVTGDGHEVETQGPWEVRGRMVVFTRPDGNLASIRLSEVDLEASERRTHQARQPTSEPPRQPERAAVLVLGDGDIRQVRPGASAAAAAAGEGGSDAESAGEKSADRAPVDDLVVANWSGDFNAVENRVEVTGRVRNDGKNYLTTIKLTVSLYNEEGAIVGQQKAALDSETLGPGRLTAFRAEFPDLTTFAEARFTASSSGYLARRDEEGEPGAEGVDEGVPPFEGTPPPFEEEPPPFEEPPPP